MLARSKFLAFVLDPLISYLMHTCVYNFHYYFDIDPFFPLQYEKKQNYPEKKWR